MNNAFLICTSIWLIIVASCARDNVQRPNQPAFASFNATTLCTTYNSNGTILQVGTPYNHAVTMENSNQPGFDYHFKNFTGDNDTTVYAAKNIAQGYFTIPSQQFKTSNNSLLTISGQGYQIGDSLTYSWSFYINPNYKSHDCVCKAKK